MDVHLILWVNVQNFHLFCIPIVSALAIRSFFCLALVLVFFDNPQLFWSTFLNLLTTRHFRFIMYLPCPSGIKHFSKESVLLLLQNDV